jgi:hypothetical protein
MLVGLVGGPLVLLNGVVALDDGSTWKTVSGWFMVVGGAMMMLGGGLVLRDARRRKH